MCNSKWHRVPLTSPICPSAIRASQNTAVTDDRVPNSSSNDRTRILFPGKCNKLAAADEPVCRRVSGVIALIEPR
jgi:hypothetical protein